MQEFDFTQYLRYYQAEFKVSNAALARKFKVSRKTISSYLAGTKSPNIHQFTEILQEEGLDLIVVDRKVTESLRVIGSRAEGVLLDHIM